MAKANGQYSTDCWPMSVKSRRAQLPGDIGRPARYYGEVPEARWPVASQTGLCRGPTTKLRRAHPMHSTLAQACEEIRIKEA